VFCTSVVQHGAATFGAGLQTTRAASYLAEAKGGMEIWKTLRVSHIPTPPATTDKCLTRPLVAQSGFSVGPGECHAIKSRRHCEDDLTFLKS